MGDDGRQTRDERSEEGKNVNFGRTCPRTEAASCGGHMAEGKRPEGIRGYRGFPGRFSRSIAFPATCDWKVPRRGCCLFSLPSAPCRYPVLCPCLPAGSYIRISLQPLFFDLSKIEIISYSSSQLVPG